MRDIISNRPLYWLDINEPTMALEIAVFRVQLLVWRCSRRNWKYQRLLCQIVLENSSRPFLTILVQDFSRVRHGKLWANGQSWDKTRFWDRYAKVAVDAGIGKGDLSKALCELREFVPGQGWGPPLSEHQLPSLPNRRLEFVTLQGTPLLRILNP